MKESAAAGADQSCLGAGGRGFPTIALTRLCTPVLNSHAVDFYYWAEEVCYASAREIFGASELCIENACRYNPVIILHEQDSARLRNPAAFPPN